MNKFLQYRRRQGKKVHFCNFGLWTLKLSGVGSRRDQKTCEEVKMLKKLWRFYPFVYKCTVETNFKQCKKVTMNKKMLGPSIVEVVVVISHLLLLLLSSSLSPDFHLFDFQQGQVGQRCILFEWMNVFLWMNVMNEWMNEWMKVMNEWMLWMKEWVREFIGATFLMKEPRILRF